MTGKLPRSRLAALALIFAVHPQHLACGGIESNHRATRSCRDEQGPVDHQGSSFILIFRPRPERIRLESPGDLELVEVLGIDLIEWRVSRAAGIAAIRAPLPIG